MQHDEGAHDTWFHRRFGPGAWDAMAPAQRLAWCLAGMGGALALLAAFYGVLHQSLARADQHWARAPGGGGVERCVSGRASADKCSHAALDAVGLREASPAARFVASPR